MIGDLRRPWVPADIRLACRRVSAARAALLPAEAASFATLPASLRAPAAAARSAARILLAPHGHDGHPFPRSRNRPPAWPAGLVGSMAHCDTLAVAALGPASAFAGIGIDVEPSDPLPPDVAGIALSHAERASLSGLPDRAVFAIKEAVFKATNPLDGQFLDFCDVSVDLVRGRATTSTGHGLGFALAVRRHLVALAWLVR